MMWLTRLLRRKKMEDQLEKEVRFHIEQHASDLIARGSDPAEARRRARIELGGPEQVKEQCRDARGTRWIDNLWQDVKYAFRMLRQKPGFAAVTIGTLALGIGATTVMFTVIDGVLFKPLPYPNAEKLLRVEEQTKGIVDYRWGDRWAFSYPNFVDCFRDSKSVLAAAYRYRGGTLSGSGDPEYVDGLEISSDLFSVLGVQLWQGRAFLAEEDRSGGTPVMVIGHGLWQRRFGGNAAAIGTSINFEGKPYTIVGVTPPGFDLREAQVFTPIGQNDLPFMRNRSAHPGINVVARLRPGATVARAQSELDMVAHRLGAEYPKSNKGRGFVAEILRPNVGKIQSMLWLLLGGVGLVLLIACVNVASLLLARAVSRQRELAMRVALGAGRGRLVRQCLTESAVLGILGGTLGVLLAAAGLRPFVALWPGGLPRASQVQFDWSVLLFALAVSMFCGLLFGMAPALRAPARDLEQALRAGARTLVGNSRRLHAGFVVAEIVLAVILLVSAGILGRTLLRLSTVDPGLNTKNVLITRMAISPAIVKDPARMRAAWQDVLEQARRVPGVQAVATVDTVPMREGSNQIGYWLSPPEPERSKKPLVLANSVSPDYLKVMGIPLRRGRFIDERDRRGTEMVAVIDDVMAQRAFGGQDPIGKRFWSDLVPEPLRVVGVVGHVRQWGLAGDDSAQVREQFYYPFAQVPDEYVRRWSELMSIAVRTSVPPLSVVQPLQHALRGSASDQVLYEPYTMEQLAAGTIARQRFLLVLFGAFSALALVLACIGIYGVLAYLTSQRVPEIGVRMALGADGRAVMRMVLRQSLAMIAMGAILGLAGAWAASRLLLRWVEGMQPAGLSTYALMVLVLTAAALLASFLPARRASRVDPVRALRQE